VKDVAVHEASGALRASGTDEPSAVETSLRQRAANFWLNNFFGACKYFPWLVRAGRPFFVWGATACSQQIQSATAANARRILGPDATDQHCQRFARAVTGHFYDFVADVGRAVRLTPEQMYARVSHVEGLDRYLAARAAKRGAIVVTAHMGSFEVGLAALRHYEQRVHVVFRRDPEDGFDQIRQQLRQRLGVIEAPVEDGWGVWLRLRDALMADEVVVVQGDRVMPGQKGQRVKLFDAHVELPTGPVKLAQASGAPLIPIFSLREPDGSIRIVIEEAIDVAPEGSDPMQRLAAVLEKHVRLRSEQWLRFEPAFCEDRESTNGQGHS
jgi:KDO2-lipid IV(A) lauroyltransferase